MKLNSRGPAGRRLPALLVAGALATSALTTAGSLPAQAAEPEAAHDPAPARAAAGWLSAQLTGGLIHNPNYGGFDDYGLSIDTALALDAVGGHTQAVDEIADAVAAAADAYTTGGPGSPDVYAGATAKAAVLAQVAGRPGDDPGVEALVQRLEGRTTDTGPAAGRIEDGFDPTSVYGADYANVIGQGFAARALTTAGSPEASAATSYLLAQQCEAGYFRLSFPASTTAPAQGCDAGTGAESAPDTDVTAMTVLALDAMSDDPAVAAEVSDAVGDATAWLVGAQRPDGSFGGGTATEQPNTNSTGLAGWALGLVGETAAAERAAGWVRRHQAGDIAPCVSALATETGALAYDRAAFVQGTGKGIGTAIADQWQRATAQALPALAWSATDATGTPAVAAPRGFLRGASLTTVTVRDLAPGQAFCVSRGTTRVASSATADGTGQVRVSTGERTGTWRWTVATATGRASVSLQVLGDKVLRPQIGRARLTRGQRQVVRVRGLASGEQVVVRLRGAKVSTGRATRAGVYVARFVVRGKRGAAQVRVLGQFPDRAGTARFRVG